MTERAGDQAERRVEEFWRHADHSRREPERCAGERHALIGPNGAGKTTLFNLISGRFPITAGEIRLDGVRLEGCRQNASTGLGLSRSFQITSIFPRLSVFENMRCALLWSRGYRYSFWHLLPGSAR